MMLAHVYMIYVKSRKQTLLCETRFVTYPDMFVQESSGCSPPIGQTPGKRNSCLNEA